MSEFASAQAIENIVGYKFRSRYDDLQKALRAAGAVEEDWDGNRKLAQLGTALSEFLLNYLAFEAGVTRAYANDFKTKVTSNEHRASIARRTGISDHITFNEQEGAQSASVLAKAVNAVIAVVFFDCGQDIGVVLKTMRHLGIFTLAGQSVDPALLSLDELPNSLDVKSLARSLFSTDMNSHSLSTAASDDQSFLTCPSTQLDATMYLRVTASGKDDLGGVQNGIRRFPIQDNHGFDGEEADVEFAADCSPDGGMPTAAPIIVDREEAESCDTTGAAGQSGNPTGKRGDIDRGGLQDILESCKTQERCTTSEAMCMVSRAERIRVIASLGHTMSRSQLLRRYHILQLFKDCGGPNTSTWEIAVTPSSLTQRSGKRGNPLNRSVADLTERMMEETFPAVDSSTDEYTTKYRWISDIRRLGQRLYMLETRFGKGILGLMLDQGVAGTDIGITDKMIMTPNNVEYAEFLDILDKSQGDLLRGLSRAVLPTVQALTLGDVHEWRLFDVGDITVDDIMKYPKGSSVFLELINKAV
ncbi:hypothetical protein AALT_g11689 [Alternaria alternata]|nr:hypothetical protein AALT_g11689 [Alternaria alternata]